MDAVIFGLAYLGYLGLCGVALLHAAGRHPRLLTAGTTGVVLVHVLLVWQVRFGWSTGAALAGGPAPWWCSTWRWSRSSGRRSRRCRGRAGSSRSLSRR